MAGTSRKQLVPPSLASHPCCHGASQKCHTPPELHVKLTVLRSLFRSKKAIRSTLSGRFCCCSTVKLERSLRKASSLCFCVFLPNPGRIPSWCERGVRQLLIKDDEGGGRVRKMLTIVDRGAGEKP